MHGMVAGTAGLHVRLSIVPLFVQWIEKVIGWLSRVFLQDSSMVPSTPEASSTLKRWRCHVQRFFYRIYASMRIEELFSIIRGERDPCVLSMLC